MRRFAVSASLAAAAAIAASTIGLWVPSFGAHAASAPPPACATFSNTVAYEALYERAATLPFPPYQSGTYQLDQGPATLGSFHLNMTAAVPARFRFSYSLAGAATGCPGVTYTLQVLATANAVQPSSLVADPAWYPLTSREVYGGPSSGLGTEISNQMQWCTPGSRSNDSVTPVAESTGQTVSPSTAAVLGVSNGCDFPSTPPPFICVVATTSTVGSKGSPIVLDRAPNPNTHPNPTGSSCQVFALADGGGSPGGQFW